MSYFSSNPKENYCEMLANQLQSSVSISRLTMSSGLLFHHQSILALERVHSMTSSQASYMPIIELLVHVLHNIHLGHQSLRELSSLPNTRLVCFLSMADVMIPLPYYMGVSL